MQLPKCYQVFIYHTRPPLKISSQSVYNILSNVAYRQTDKQTNVTENITSFVKAVIFIFILFLFYFYFYFLIECFILHKLPEVDFNKTLYITNKQYVF